jgi:hypothetical protein
MSTYYKETMLLQTFIELDNQISGLARLISANRYIEIGDDPTLVQKIESTLGRVYSKVKSIKPHFDLNITSLHRANYYFDLIRRINDTLLYLEEVRKKDYGSRQHTRELLQKLDDCANSLSAISELVSVNTKAVH